MEIRLCPLPYEEVLEDIIRTVWTEQCGLGKKKNRGPEAMPKFLILMCIYGIFATVTVLRGTRWVP